MLTRAIALLVSRGLVFGDRANNGIKIHSFKLTELGYAVDAAAKYRGWGNMVVLEP